MVWVRGRTIAAGKFSLPPPPSHLIPRPQDLRAAQPAGTTLAASCFFGTEIVASYGTSCSYLLLLPHRERSLVL